MDPPPELPARTSARSPKTFFDFIGLTPPEGYAREVTGPTKLV
ncbi:MAG: hypothetical protein ACR2IE_10010 [Candidatus Sumerlaeaceae bacterium]